MLKLKIIFPAPNIKARYSFTKVVGIATRYGLGGPGIESRCRRYFDTRPNRPWGYPASYTTDTGSFPGVKRPGRGEDHPPHSNAEVKKRVVLYIYSLFGSSWPVPGSILPFIRRSNFFCGHNILTQSVFVTQLSGNAGVSRWRIAWVTIDGCFMTVTLFRLRGHKET